MINEQCDKLIGKSNFRFIDDVTLHTKKSVIIETWHVQRVMEGSSDSGIGIKFLIILIHSAIFRRGFDIAWSDKMFLPIFDVIEFDNVNQSLGSYHQSLDHYSVQYLLWLIYKIYENNNLDFLFNYPSLFVILSNFKFWEEISNL